MTNIPDPQSDLLAEVERQLHDDAPEMQHNALTKLVDRAVEKVGELFSWIWLVLLAVIIGNVILRYVFSQGMIELEELQWYLYAAAWLVGLSYTFVQDGHVRVDVLHERLAYRTRLWLELLGLVVLFLPFVLFVTYYSIPFVQLSWETGETSTSANGLGARWLIKGCLTFAFVLLIMVGLSRLIRVLLTLRHEPVMTNREAET
jgi:TRAP-type mannitol/chloroaromatic compound transport system permease small subunit